MAAALVHKKQTGSGATATLAITKATSGNLLIAFVVTSTTSAEPSMTGWTLSTTKATGQTANNKLWLFYKNSAGTEEEIAPTAGAGGSVTGISYFEFSGATATTDGIAGKDNSETVTTITSGALTTTETGDVIVAGVGCGASMGTIKNWSGGPPTLSNNNEVPEAETTATRCLGGWSVPGALVEAKTVTAEWTTSQRNAIIVVAFKASGGESKLKPLAAKSTSALDTPKLSVVEEPKLKPVAAKSLSAQNKPALAVVSEVKLIPVAAKEASAFGEVALVVAIPMTPVAVKSLSSLKKVELETPTSGNKQSPFGSLLILGGHRHHIRGNQL